MKIATPTTPADTFYFNFDLRDLKSKLQDENTATLEISLFRYYIALYPGCIQWGKVDEDGYLWLIDTPGQEYKLPTLTVTNNKQHKMSKSIALSLLAQGNTGSEILSILDALVADNVSGFDYIESPQLESALGVPTLEEIAF